MYIHRYQVLANYRLNLWSPHKISGIYVSHIKLPDCIAIFCFIRWILAIWIYAAFVSLFYLCFTATDIHWDMWWVLMILLLPKYTLVCKYPSTQVHISMQYACHGRKYRVVLTRADNILMISSEDLLMIFLIIFWWSCYSYYIIQQWGPGKEMSGCVD